jgi:EAL domain-containing protein (putative c-di-GMP-specific phosphodiesterase class I)
VSSQEILGRTDENFAINSEFSFLPACRQKWIDLLVDPTMGVMNDAARSLAQSYQPGIGAQEYIGRQFECELRNALQRNEFKIYYQPQIELSRRKVVGAEALLRWQHTTRGLLNPGDFVESLFKSPIGAAVGDWVLQEACQQASRWQRVGWPIRIGVNLCPAQFAQGTLLLKVKEALQLSGLQPDLLELEITENIALGYGDANPDAFGALRKTGVKISFDDFGTGCASLSDLLRYPISRIKIDQSFISGVPDKAKQTALLRLLIKAAKALELGTIAEGVETEGQAELLQAEGCQEAQGFFFGRPLPAEQFENLLRPLSAIAAANGAPLNDQ